MLSLWGIGDLMVIFMAALLDVPKEQYEAAELDGAGPWARFRYVTWPNITPIVMFAVVTGVVQTMQYYTQALVAGKLASGVTIGPGTVIQPGYPDHSTITVPQLVYQLGFQNFNTSIIMQYSCYLSVGINTSVNPSMAIGIFSQWWVRTRYPRWFTKYKCVSWIRAL